MQVVHIVQAPLQRENSTEITVYEKVITGSNGWKLQSDKFELKTAMIMWRTGDNHKICEKKNLLWRICL